MTILTKTLATLVALEFFFIFYLETVATTSARTAKVFQMAPAELRRRSVQTLFKNQGVYNGLIGVLVLLATFAYPSLTALMALMSFIILVAIYGSFTSNPKIILLQGGLPILTLIACWV